MLNFEELVRNTITCQKNEYCTNCTERRDCLVRKQFYFKEEYMERIRIVNISMLSFSIKTGYDLSHVITELDEFFNEIEKKRKRELEEHPTYSPE